VAATAEEVTTRIAKAPFEFKSATHLLRIEAERSSTLGELLRDLNTCPDASIFQHTFRTLQEHHFIKEGFSNDFAHWAYTECGAVGLGERLAAIDVREFTAIADLRARLETVVEDYLQLNPQSRDHLAEHPFYFCSAESVVTPTEIKATNLAEFVQGLRAVSIHSIHYHFIEARLRRHLETNDFSIWLKRDLGMNEAAVRLNKIDIYTATLEGVRRQIARILEGAVS